VFIGRRDSAGRWLVSVAALLDRASHLLDTDGRGHAQRRDGADNVAARYHDHMRRRLVVKPGITGLWQVSGRSDLAWADAVRLDLRYVENWSLALDLQILWKTGSAVFHGHGAY
jgi:sugar transferase